MRKILVAVAALAVLLTPVLAEAKASKCPGCGNVKFWYPQDNK
jgi:hypothetical protein